MSKPTVNLDEPLTPEECARWMKVPLRTLEDRRRSGDVPHNRIGKHIRYWPRAILEFTLTPKPKGRNGQGKAFGGSSV